MDEERARVLLARERERIEDGLAAAGRDTPLEGDQLWEAGERDSEDLYLDDLSAARREELERDLAALERAEARLAAGKYGLSIDSGEPIPDARLEALPLAERTL
ncbi:MAG TPA: hypothetical protein VGI50_02025, partial [Solirubrobacteraceae bacterium]